MARHPVNASGTLRGVAYSLEVKLGECKPFGELKIVKKSFGISKFAEFQFVI